MDSGAAAEQGDEADEAWSTSELRSLSPVFDGRDRAMSESICGACGYVGRPTKELRGSGALELVLLLCGVVPGLAYGWWRHQGPILLCRRCRQRVLSAESPEGRALLASRPGGAQGLSRLERIARVVRLLPAAGGAAIVVLMVASILFPDIRNQPLLMWLLYAAVALILAHPVWFFLQAFLAAAGRPKT